MVVSAATFKISTPAYAEAEREARAAKRGLWASGTAINPYQWRKENKRR